MIQLAVQCVDEPAALELEGFIDNQSLWLCRRDGLRVSIQIDDVDELESFVLFLRDVVGFTTHYHGALHHCHA